MKFGHEFKEALWRERFPVHWIESAVPYSQLKKCIKKVESELRDLGLGSETLRHLSSPNRNEDNETQSRVLQNSDSVAFEYDFAEHLKAFRPRLTIYIQLEAKVTTDASLAPETRKHLERFASQRQLTQSPFPGLTVRSGGEGARLPPLSLTGSKVLQESLASSGQAVHSIQQVEVPLMFDAEFFELLQVDILNLDNLQEEEQKAMVVNIKALGRVVTKVATPSSTRKTDLSRWRELFDLYLQASIFFSTNELDHGSRNSTAATKQLQWFQAEASRKGLPGSFKLSASRQALEKFIGINLTLLHNLRFQEMNKLAVSKILKKFDKRTSLHAKNTFPRLIQSDLIMSETMAKAISAEISNEIIKIVPQIDDYLCPVCFSISYKPIRLKCGHIFCICCVIRLQKKKNKFCPLCRNDVVMGADSDNIDTSLKNFLQKFFPDETRAKQKENEIAAGVELFGEGYTDSNCILM